LYVGSHETPGESSSLLASQISFTGAGGDSSYLTSSSLNLTSSSGASINMDASGLPSGAYVYFNQISVCVGGKTQKAWVLMSTPED
jgi:hypothetical protein